uniref:DUF4025 domain-containing protein n=1 Tax=Heterorhabditis bacteriophora TaxID=37862 RepID=A0A1I7WHT8_HETBA
MSPEERLRQMTENVNRSLNTERVHEQVAGRTAYESAARSTFGNDESHIEPQFWEDSDEASSHLRW